MDANAQRSRRPMRAIPGAAAATLVVALLTGCAGQLPRLAAEAGDEALAPRVSHIVQQVQCEVIETMAKGRLAGLGVAKLAVGVDLTLDVTDRGSFNPTLGFIDPRADGVNNVTLGIGGQYSREQHRNVHVTFTVIADAASATEDRLGDCRAMRKGSGLRGDLGIEEILATGLPFIAGSPPGPENPYVLPAVGVGTSKGAPSDPDPPAFGTTVDFELVYGVSGGPTWTLTHFVGPGVGLLDARRTAKDTLVLGFVAFQAKPRGGPQGLLPLDQADEEDSNRASRAVQGEITRQILRSLNLNAR
jgi:hypothetical protein